MLITSTPYRVSFFGGGTDYPVWFREHGGAVLATSINHYCYLTCRFLPPFHGVKYRVVWSKIELANCVEDIDHPAVRAAIQHLGVGNGLEIHHHGDLPARSGLGSSSAFSVCMLHALHALSGKLVSKLQLADQAIYLEQDVMNENVGIQDQITTAHGGLNRVTFDQNGDYRVEPLPISAGRRRELNQHLLLIYSGVARNASDVAAQKIASIPERTAALHEMRKMVDDGVDILTSGGDVLDFGRLLHESWMLKRSITSSISTNLIDDIYARARRAGAVGGKVLGAGGGGFVLLFVAPEKRQAVLEELEDFLHVPFEFENNGTRVVHFDPSP